VERIISYHIISPLPGGAARTDGENVEHQNDLRKCPMLIALAGHWCSGAAQGISEMASAIGASTRWGRKSDTF